MLQTIPLHGISKCNTIRKSQTDEFANGTSGGELWLFRKYVRKSYLGDLKNSALGHFWEIFLGGDGMGLLTSAENLEKFGKIWKIAKIQGGDRV